MKITISPSYKEENHLSATVDTLTNDDTTEQIVEAALAAIIAVGHRPKNVAEAAEKYAGENSEN